MTERVNTGELVSFEYPKGYTPRRNKKVEEEIDLAWEKHYEKKRKKRKNERIILLVILALIVLGWIVWKIV